MLSFYDLKGAELDFYRKDYKPYHGAARPDNFSTMIEISRRIANAVDSPFLRVDLYSVKGEVYFSEITLHPSGGLMLLDPKEADLKLGSMLRLF